MLYGKWRPKGFDEVVGQEHIVTTLRNALVEHQKFASLPDAARKEKHDPLAHAFLFSGPRGTGKTTTARILARAVNCERLSDTGDPCNECEPCKAIGRGNALDLIEMDAASNRGIDDIRELREKIGFAPSDLKKKVYLLDEVHMLTDGAFNALLKTLEEPPPHAIFILATTDIHKVPPTILSRCQRYDFHRIAPDASLKRLNEICRGETYELPREGLLAISAQSRGGMRDAITLLEQVVARYGPTPSNADVMAALGLVEDERSGRLVRAILEEDLGEALLISRDVADSGIDMARFTKTAVDILRRMLPHVIKGAAGEDLENPQDQELVSLAITRGVGVRALVLAIGELAKADFRLDPASPIPLEMACAAAILQPEPQVVVQAAGRPAPSAGARPARPAREGSPRGEPPASASNEERFLRQLYERTSAANVKVGAMLNGSCQVLEIAQDFIELGFYHDFHLEKVRADGRVIIEQQAEIILGRPVRLESRRIERDGAAQKPVTKGGHLAEAARAMGATPVAKE